MSRLNMELVARKPSFVVSDKASFKPASSATETSWKIEISSVARLHMILSEKRITKALIRLCGCAGWSATVLFANPRRQVFSHRGPYKVLQCQYQPRIIIPTNFVYIHNVAYPDKSDWLMNKFLRRIFLNWFYLIWHRKVFHVCNI